MLSLMSAILVLCNLVEISKIANYFELLSTKYIYFGDKVFQHISVGLSRLIDRLFTNLLNINLTEIRKKELSLQVRNNLEYSNSNLPN